LRDYFRQTFAARSQAEWTAWFEGLDVCFAPVRDLKEAFDDPFLIERGLLSFDEDGSEIVGTPIRFRDEPAVLNSRAPAKNQDGEDIARNGWGAAPATGPQT
jgi:crotonobetainyl-CoA:carnitine CoA-transferase CaiB-like acyl-CoA transferase